MLELAMPSLKYQQVVDFLICNFEQLDYEDGSGTSLNFPSFELMPFDYLEFAEEELEKKTPAARINCVGHLKRAVESELDTILSVLNLSGLVKGFPKKLEFVGDIGIVSPRSLVKLNKMRNRMEHEYAIPESHELEVYFDLASSFVHTLEGYIFMLCSNAEMGWRCHSGNRLEMKVTLDESLPRVQFSLMENGVSSNVTFDVSPLSEFCEGLKIYFQICRAMALISKVYVLSKLTGTPLHASGHP